MSNFFEVVLLTVSGLLPIANPFSTAPLFASLTAGLEPAARDRQALKGCLYAFAILVTFLLVGAFIVDFFGISIPGIRIAGGLIILVIGFRMLFPDTQASSRAASDAQHQNIDVSFTPIAMPSLAGPGSISVVLSGAALVREEHSEDMLWIHAAIIVGMAITLAVAYVVLRLSGYMVRFLGRGGIDAMTRIFGFLLICIAMQFLLTGIDDFFLIRPR